MVDLLQRSGDFGTSKLGGVAMLNIHRLIYRPPDIAWDTITMHLLSVIRLPLAPQPIRIQAAQVLDEILLGKKNHIHNPRKRKKNASVGRDKSPSCWYCLELMCPVMHQERYWYSELGNWIKFEDRKSTFWPSITWFTRPLVYCHINKSHFKLLLLHD